MTAGHFAQHPFQVGLVARECFDEVRSGHTSTLDAGVEHSTLKASDFLNLATQCIRQSLNHFGREANAHHLILNSSLCIQISVRLIAAHLISLPHFFKLFADNFKLGKRLDTQSLNLFTAHAASGAVLIAVICDTSTRVFSTVFGVNQAVNNLFNLSL